MIRGSTGHAIGLLKAAKSLTADTYGAALDVINYTGQALVAVVPGTATSDSLGTASLTITILTGDSSGGGDNTDTKATITLDSTTAASITSLDLSACDRYIRAYCNIGAHTTAFAVAIALVADDSGF